ncbi:MAG TPA: sugar phosphate nucleotidyltransferase [Vicinamibacterales bacterium]|nr:sugar phosphate nucleotidyltransferase [Vicinamibacterales bacterium]
MQTTFNWGVILAGGDGSRLQPLTQLLSGDSRPKQFCRLLARQTLLGATRSRLCQIVAPEHTLYVVNDQHRLFYKDELGDVRQQNLIEQPANRGTAPAVLYALARLRRMDPEAVVGFFPADHHFDNVSAFHRVVAGAYWAAREDPTRVVMVGSVPTYPEPDYGWITRGTWQPRTSVAANFPVYAVESFIEKPKQPLAMSLMATGALWNTFIMVGRLRTFFSMFAAAAPRLCLGLGPLVSSVGLAGESLTAAAVYSETPSVDLSRDVLMVQPERLSVMEAPSMGWTDLGRVDRVLALRATAQMPHAGADADLRLAAS